MPTILTPEEKAGAEIGRQLGAAGWQVQDRENQSRFAQERVGKKRQDSQVRLPGV